MAYSENVETVSVVAATTFAAADLYKFVVLNTNGQAILPNTTGNVLPFGVLYSQTQTTSTGAEAVTVAIGGIAQVRMAASTASVGNFIGSDTNGRGAAPSTDGYVAGQIVAGASGAIGRVVSAKLFTGPLNTP